jgi:preprotein translocase subunit SecE
VTRRELIGYWPMVVLTVVVMTVAALTVAFKLGG